MSCTFKSDPKSLSMALDSKMPNGKIDYINLPNPLLEMNESKHTPPQNDMEIKLAQLLKAAIGLPDKLINRESNFFDLGGTSIHLMAVKYQIKEKFSVDISMEQLFHNNSLKSLSEQIQKAKSSSSC